MPSKTFTLIEVVPKDGEVESSGAKGEDTDFPEYDFDEEMF